MRPEIIIKITKNVNPLKVNLANMKICDNEILEIIKTIKQFKPDTVVIDLDNNNISDEGATILTQQIRGFNDMKEISLQYNQIGRKGAIELFSLNKEFSDLDILFHGNKITNVREIREIERLALAETPKQKIKNKLFL